MSRIVILSPHFDDAVLSCSQLIYQNDDTKVITICGGIPNISIAASSWEKRCGFINAYECASTRIEENKLALSIFSCSAIDLDFFDYPHQQHKSKEEIVKEIIPHLSNGETILAPIGIGGHLDHLLTRDVALQLKQQGCDVVFYADYPYASDNKNQSILFNHAYLKEQLKELSGSEEYIEYSIQLNKENLSKKLKSFSHYKSQIDPLNNIYLGLKTGKIIQEEIYYRKKSNVVHSLSF